MNDKCIFLGSGSSTGTPIIGCNCKVCSSKSKYDKRLRPSLLLNIKDKNILVDVGPDIRYQALKYDIKKIDALVITHAHFDHIAGIDDLRIFNRYEKKPIKCYLSNETFEELKYRFNYLFMHHPKGHTQSAQFDFTILDDDVGSFEIDNIKVNYFSYHQDSKKVTGLRFKNLAYVTDIKKFDDSIFEQLKKLDVLILSALREKKSAVHLNLQDACDFAKKVKAKNTYFTHLGHEVHHESVSSALSKNIELAYDGLLINF